MALALTVLRERQVRAQMYDWAPALERLLDRLPERAVHRALTSATCARCTLYLGDVPASSTDLEPRVARVDRGDGPPEANLSLLRPN